MTLRIGPHTLLGRVLLAPMAGITDGPFRALCHQFGAALCCAEMLTSDQNLWNSSKSRQRMLRDDEPGIRAVQLAGADPQTLAEAARAHMDLGAQIIDLNMGCPAKKVCNRLCGSALLADEELVGRIFTAVVNAVAVPVTVKIRTGPDPTRRNAVAIARLAESCGISALAVHGRTRADMFRGEAEYETIRAVKLAVRIPVIANGDLRTAAQVQTVLRLTGADGVMLGRAAQGSPWIFRDVNAYLANEKIPAPLLHERISQIILQHLESLYAFYGEYTGVRMARKHLGWYCLRQSGADALRHELLAATDSVSQYAAARRGFGRWLTAEPVVCGT
ncbi:MAG TPA: tRNA dihydrouridine synthase DusB [Steroidobacteraceae bacterium]|nr:tRNA dihydrouridine synthase DusB [Steroidobacteraceae bacterium]